MNSLIENKIEELLPYLRSVAYRRNVPVVFVEDIVQSTIARLLEEDNAETSFELWGKATNVLREEAAKGAASSLPLSGVGFQAHHYARKYLAQNDFDPQKAYYNQTESPRVSMSLLQLVAGGSASVDSINTAYLKTSRDESQREGDDRVHTMLQTLPEQMRQVVEMRIGVYSHELTMKEIAAELGISSPDARKLWNDAKAELRCSIDVSEG